MGRFTIEGWGYEFAVQQESTQEFGSSSFMAQSSSSYIFATCRAEKSRARTVLATINDGAGNGTIVPSYLLSPVPRERGGATEDVVDEDACFEYHRDIPRDVVNPVLRFLGGLSFPLVSLRWFFMNTQRVEECGLDNRLRGQFG
jgi:hypothetical protein